jgi:microcystin degradation protein MlrC
MRFVIALFKHETNTFSAMPTRLSSFNRGSMVEGPCHGTDAVAVSRGTNNAVAAYLDLADRLAADVDYVVYANAVPSGIVQRDAFEAIVAPIVTAAQQECDAVLLDLHGAMVAQGYPDAEGEIVRRVRQVNPHVPIVVALDFHANISEQLIRNASVVTGYRTYPHVDVYETGERAARVLQAMLGQATQPVLMWRRLPMMTQLLKQSPSVQPMKDIMDRARAAEAQGTVLCASLFAGFPLSDVPDLGFSVVVVAERGKEAQATALFDDLCALAWERRHDFTASFDDFTLSLQQAALLPDGPILLVDHGDNCASGGSTDEMSVLREALALGMSDIVAGPFWDPGTVDVLARAGVGSTCTVDVGGKTDMPAIGLAGMPLRLTGKVLNVTDGKFTVTGPMFTGMQISLGRTAVLDTGRAVVVITEKPQEPFDAGVFTHAGIDPFRKKYILVKSKQHFRAGFGPRARHVVMIAGPGVCSSDFSKFPFKNIARPIFPLDADVDLSCASQWPQAT